jgi:adenylate cyclase
LGADSVDAAGRRHDISWTVGPPLGSKPWTENLERDPSLDLERVGEYPVRGFNDPIELFAYHG